MIHSSAIQLIEKLINYLKEMINCLINERFQETYIYIGLFILFALLQLLVKYIFDMLRNQKTGCCGG